MSQLPTAILFLASRVLRLDEGLRNKPYLDSKNFWTIGIGHLIGREIKELELSDAVVLKIFEEDMQLHWTEAVTLFGDDYMQSLEPSRQIAILTLVYTLGRRKLGTFFQTLPALKNKQWELAAKLLLQTQWAIDVDPKQRPGEGRDDRIAYMLLTGEFHADYKIDNSDVVPPYLTS